MNLKKTGLESFFNTDEKGYITDFGQKSKICSDNPLLFYIKRFKKINPNILSYLFDKTIDSGNIFYKDIDGYNFFEHHSLSEKYIVKEFIKNYISNIDKEQFFYLLDGFEKSNFKNLDIKELFYYKFINYFIKFNELEKEQNIDFYLKSINFISKIIDYQISDCRNEKITTRIQTLNDIINLLDKYYKNYSNLEKNQKQLLNKIYSDIFDVFFLYDPKIDNFLSNSEADIELKMNFYYEKIRPINNFNENLSKTYYKFFNNEKNKEKLLKFCFHNIEQLDFFNLENFKIIYQNLNDSKQRLSIFNSRLIQTINNLMLEEKYDDLYKLNNIFLKTTNQNINVFDYCIDFIEKNKNISSGIIIMHNSFFNFINNENKKNNLISNQNIKKIINYTKDYKSYLSANKDKPLKFKYNSMLFLIKSKFLKQKLPNKNEQLDIQKNNVNYIDSVYKITNNQEISQKTKIIIHNYDLANQAVEKDIFINSLEEILIIFDKTQNDKKTLHFINETIELLIKNHFDKSQSYYNEFLEKMNTKLQIIQKIK